jgi:hypothetical protein
MSCLHCLSLFVINGKQQNPDNHAENRGILAIVCQFAALREYGLSIPDATNGQTGLKNMPNGP